MQTLRPLTETGRSTLERELKRSRDAGDWGRIFAILSYDEEMSIEELAKLTRLSPWTIEEYLNISLKILLIVSSRCYDCR